MTTLLKSCASLILITGAGLLGGCNCSKPSSAINVPVIDVHTHLFNARDLPLKGILRNWGIPDQTAAIVAKVLVAWTPADNLLLDDRSSPDELEPPAPASDDAQVVAAEIRGRMQPNLLLSTNDSLLQVLTADERAVLEQFAGPRLLSDVPTTNPDASDVVTVARALQKADFPPREAGGPDLTSGLGKVRGYVRFLSVVTRSHRKAAKLMSGRQYPEVRLFTHHMMDMANAYQDTPALAFDQQIPAMAALDRSTAGRTLFFVAYDPFRRQDAIDYVQRGLDAGAGGVKFYPPSGYSAADNDISDPPAKNDREKARRAAVYKELNNAQLDELNDKLFKRCVEKDTPLFTHCTPNGFEAADKMGCKSDPKYWAIALQNNPELRLCFGHSGGDAYWFPGASDQPVENQRFGEQVVDLCLTYKNVYCEVGYLEKILEPSAVKSFQRRLAEVMNRKSVDGTWRFGDKIMYGTDWFMIATQPHPETYLHDFWNAFDTDALRPWRKAFFAGNAARYLKLDALASENQPPRTAEQRATWQKLINDLKAAK